MKERAGFAWMACLTALFMAATLSMAAIAPVSLGTAANFTILAKTGISNTGTTTIIGNVGISPAAASFITGFGLIVDSTSQFSASSLVNGNVYASDYAPPTPAKMATAVSDMGIAYADAAGRTPPDTTGLGSGNIGGMTLIPGLYKWGTNLTIPTNVTLSGSATDVWIFQIAGTLTISPAQKVILSGGAQARNIFWQVAGQTTLGTTSVFNGNILCQSAIVMNTGATHNGRALAQAAVALDSAIVVGSSQTPTSLEKGKIVIYGNVLDVSSGARARIFAKGEANKTVKLSVYNRAGKRVSEVPPITLDSAGAGYVWFDGKDSSGKQLLAGIYLIVGPEGQKAQIVIKRGVK